MVLKSKKIEVLNDSIVTCNMMRNVLDRLEEADLFDSDYCQILDSDLSTLQFLMETILSSLKKRKKRAPKGAIKKSGI